MALFGQKKNTEEKSPSKAKKTAAAVKTASAVKRVAPKKQAASRSPQKANAAATFRGESAWVLRAPRITEKASRLMEGGVYVFTVSLRATKRDVAHAVREIYGVLPMKVRMVRIPDKVVYAARSRRRGVKRGGKKAYIHLRKGETISVV